MNLLRIFYRPKYQSEATQFIDQLKFARPELDLQQYQGRALLWDKAVDRDTARDIAQARLAQKPYVYQTDSH